jgi:endogenous inhibitor of DNA gyrase (YacG/DUF329 family)
MQPRNSTLPIFTFTFTLYPFPFSVFTFMPSKCPNCQRSTRMDPENRWRPFCSERCRLIDLGAWIDEQHRIPSDDPAAPAPGPEGPVTKH